MNCGHLRVYHAKGLPEGESEERHGECLFCRIRVLERENKAMRILIEEDRGPYDEEGLQSLLTSVLHNEPWQITKKEAIEPTVEAANAFWKYWRENGETHKHGYYESTWGAINAALNATVANRSAKP